MRVKIVESKRDLKKFIKLPYELYKFDKTWIPPLQFEQKARFNKNKSSMLKKAEHVFIILLDKDKVIGRIAAFIDAGIQKAWNMKIGFFGSYECIDDDESARILFDEAKKWLKERNVEIIRGPMNFGLLEYGFLYEGYHTYPVISSNHNFSYYNEHVKANGFHKVKDLLVYSINKDDQYEFPMKLLNLTSLIQKKYGVRVRTINKKDFKNELSILLNLINESTSQNWGFYEADIEEAKTIAKDILLLIDENTTFIAEDNSGKPIGFLLPFKDLNTIIRQIKGKLFPFGWWKLLKGVKKINNYRIWGLGVIPEYQGKAIDALLYVNLYKYCSNKGKFYFEVNWVLEDNFPMLNAVKNLNGKYLKRYRVYDYEFPQ